MTDAKPVLYVVNTGVEPGFLNIDFAAEHPEQVMRGHSTFIRRVREQHPGFNLPYVALFPDGGLQIPFPGPLCGALVGGVQEGMTDRMPLDEFIAKYVGGKDTIMRGHTIPITGVVEFSPTELYPAPMERLGARYELRRITVN